jgi:acyl-CoA thioesterase-1
MRSRYGIFWLLALLGIGQAGCVSSNRAKLERSEWESVVLSGEAPAALAHVPVKNRPFVVRNRYLPKSDAIQYEQGRDFVVDYDKGLLRRTAQSRIPDFGTNVLFGKEDFNHGQFPGYGNGGFFVFADYSFVVTNRWPVQARQDQFMTRTQAKLRAGEAVKIVAFGDSITAGGEATQPSLIFWQRWADDLPRKYPQARITAVNGATGGDSTVQGLERLEVKVLKERPDLVLIAFGMNDHNIGGVPIALFEANLKEMMRRIRASGSTEIVLLSCFPPNPKWHFGSHHMADYAAATAKVAIESHCAYADVFNNWVAIEQRKKPEDLLGNNINHPNDFGHWIYFQVLKGMGL